METFIGHKEFEPNPRYAQDRQNTLAALNLGTIDEPIVDIVTALAKLSYCFPLQSCYGHFICTPEQDIHTLDLISAGHTGTVRYRIAYIALCIENSIQGRQLRERLSEIPIINPEFIQFGCAEWFWEQFLNTYVLQVAPESHREDDQIWLDGREASKVQIARSMFFKALRALVEESRPKI